MLGLVYMYICMYIHVDKYAYPAVHVNLWDDACVSYHYLTYQGFIQEATFDAHVLKSL